MVGLFGGWRGFGWEPCGVDRVMAQEWRWRLGAWLRSERVLGCWREGAGVLGFRSGA